MFNHLRVPAQEHHQAPGSRFANLRVAVHSRRLANQAPIRRHTVFDKVPLRQWNNLKQAARSGVPDLNHAIRAQHQQPFAIRRKLSLEHLAIVLQH